MPRKAKTELNLNTETDSKAAVKTKTAAKTLSKTAKTSAKKSASETKAAAKVKAKSTASKAKAETSETKAASKTKAKSTASKAKVEIGETKAVSKTKAKSTASKVKAEISESKSAAKVLSKTAAKNFSKAEGKTLIIVESPSKATTLSGILGSKYIVRSSKGHIRDLPKSRMAIDIEHDFAPEYILVQGKAELKKELIELAAGAKEVLLASDPDREGEAIAWHLADILGVSLNQKCRVRFYEITANAVKNAVKAPDYIDLNKVDAQQARRILDRLVGYTLSPLLWKKVKYGLSAGRVQSVALNLICEREREILKFEPTPYWAISVEAESKDKKRKYYLKAEKFNKKSLLKNSLPLLINSEEFANEILNEIKNNKLIVKDFTQKNSKREAPAPFRTSTLQQEASRRLSMSPRMTMMVAQSLYEGFNIPGRGHIGLITYMRTDSLRLSDEAVSSCREFISNNFKAEYLPDKANIYAAPGRAQDAHEAIRPTDVSITPELARDFLNPEQARLYEMIWRRFTASQMSQAVVAKSVLKAEAGEVELKSEGESLIFDGWSAVWPLDLKGDNLSAAKSGEELKILNINKDQKFTRPPARYSEAGLIKILEENGVGRPSTYATIAGTLDTRGYVERNEEKRFCPTELGMIVDSFLMQYFKNNSISSIVDAGFTAQMEKELDEVEEARLKWLQVVGDFWKDFSKTLDKAQSAEHVKMPEPQPIGENCPECGKPLVKKDGRFGEFIGCSGYPECKYTRNVLDKTGVACPKCGAEHGGEIVKRRSKKGRRTFFGCSRFPECDYTSWLRPTNNKCPKCGNILFKRGKTLICQNAGCNYKAVDESSEQEF